MPPGVQILKISPPTVMSQVQKILRKLQVSNRVQAHAKGIRTAYGAGFQKSLHCHSSGSR